MTPPGPVTVSVGCIVIDEPERGVWCPECNLPSAVRFRIAMTLDGKPWKIQNVTCCRDCGTGTRD